MEEIIKTRQTIQRSLILTAVQKLDHPTAEEVYGEISNHHPSISKATVYRNLNLLAETGEIQKLQTVDSSDHYDWRTQKHAHFHCNTCKRIIDIGSYKQEAIFKLLNVNPEFQIDDEKIVLTGLCPDCRIAS